MLDSRPSLTYTAELYIPLHNHAHKWGRPGTDAKSAVYANEVVDCEWLVAGSATVNRQCLPSTWSCAVDTCQRQASEKT